MIIFDLCGDRKMSSLNLSNAYPSRRSLYWDNIKGVLIILVVFGHFLFGLQNSEINNTIVDAIYLFHMPAFVFVSGYFSKSEHSRSFESLLRLLSAFILVHGIFLIFYVTPAYSARVLKSKDNGDGPNVTVPGAPFLC